MSQKVVYIIFFKKQPDVKNVRTIRDITFWLNWRNITFTIYFSFFQLMARNMLQVWNALSRNAVQRLLDQAMLVCTFAARLNVNLIKLTTNWILLLDLLHFWIILIKSIFLFYAHIWIKYLHTANLTQSCTNLLSTICLENLDV